jgi:hypothetical protein
MAPRREAIAAQAMDEHDIRRSLGIFAAGNLVQHASPKIANINSERQQTGHKPMLQFK